MYFEVSRADCMQEDVHNSGVVRDVAEVFLFGDADGGRGRCWSDANWLPTGCFTASAERRARARR